MTRRFDSKVVLITGASAGIGAAAARRFADEGARVVLAARREGPLDEMAAELRGRGAEALVVPTDVADTASCAALIERAVEELGGLDVLVNNAGAHFRGAFESRSPEEIATMVDVNVRGPLVLTRLALPHLRRSGGAVVHVASLAGMVPLPDAATYSSTKAALRIFSLALAEELRGSAVTSTLVSPGPIIDTGFLMGSLEEAADVTLSQPVSTADEVATRILECALDGERERAMPPASAALAKAAYLFPGLRRVLEPVMKERGKRKKAELQARRDRGEI
ncbi:MAG TPA: SDR family oxidoreductase [Sandaracinaceae bacterium LLY-WYZ-13_1]|nr:SDR family oxidoreductase [Sandaracinaceae bacterium LLY-WYZ-13_1]